MFVTACCSESLPCKCNETSNGASHPFRLCRRGSAFTAVTSPAAVQAQFCH
uniref:Uncharacterized protein n=1 Tax=Arundo donax TaxID=35708 RepID=A0A0A8ZYI3_ARUDO